MKSLSIPLKRLLVAILALAALASVWSPSFTIKTSNIDVQISGEVISAGAKIQIYPYFEVGAAGMLVIPHN